MAARISPEELAAYADGQLGPRRQAEVARIVAANTALAEKVRAHHTLKKRLKDHFAPILSVPPAEGSRAHSAKTKPVDLRPAGARQSPPGTPARRQLWPWIIAAALIGMLVVAAFLPRRRVEQPPANYIKGLLADRLDRQLVTTQSAKEPTRILISFRDPDGRYCRVFTGEQEGIACRDRRGWDLRYSAPGGTTEAPAETTPALLTRAQDMAASPALDAAEERNARKKGWR